MYQSQEWTVQSNVILSTHLSTFHTFNFPQHSDFQTKRNLKTSKSFSCNVANIWKVCIRSSIQRWKALSPMPLTTGGGEFFKGPLTEELLFVGRNVKNWPKLLHEFIFWKWTSNFLAKLSKCSSPENQAVRPDTGDGECFCFFGPQRMEMLFSWMTTLRFLHDHTAWGSTQTAAHQNLLGPYTN